MSDLIKRSEALNAINVSKDVEEAWENVTKLPSAQPEVIRCKDCMYYSNGECDSAEMWQNLYGETTEVECINRHPNDFCSFAERRTT